MKLPDLAQQPEFESPSQKESTEDTAPILKPAASLLQQPLQDSSGPLGKEKSAKLPTLPKPAWGMAQQIATPLTAAEHLRRLHKIP